MHLGEVASSLDIPELRMRTAARFVIALFSVTPLISGLATLVNSQLVLQRYFGACDFEGLALKRIQTESSHDAMLWIAVGIFGFLAAWLEIDLRFTLGILAIFTLFEGAVGIYLANNLDTLQATESTVAFHILFNSIFFSVFLELRNKAPIAVRDPKEPTPFLIKSMFFINFLAFLGSSLATLVSPGSYLDYSYSAFSTGRPQMVFVLFLQGISYLVLSLVSLFALFNPTKTFCIFFAALSLAQVAFFSYVIEIHDDIRVSLPLVILALVLELLLFLWASASFYFMPRLTFVSLSPEV